MTEEDMKRHLGISVTKTFILWDYQREGEKEREHQIPKVFSFFEIVKNW